MKRFIVIFLTLMFGVNNALAQKQTSIKPASVYQQDGITFASPNQSGWTLLKSDKVETVFEKRDKDAISNASVKTVKTETFETDKDRLNRFEALKKEDLSSLKRDSLHFNYVRFKGLMCLQYDGIFPLDATLTPKLKYFHLRGYLCPNPKASDSAIQIETSNYSNTRDFAEDFNSISDEFFEKVAFSKAVVKTKRSRAVKQRD
jgi:hypothetical protein